MDIIQRHYEALSALKDGDFEKAIKAYKNGIDTSSDLLGGAVHYNLGILHFRNQDLGKAIFHFRHAREQLPRNADVAFNLNYVRKQTTDKIEVQNESFLGKFVTNNYPLTFEESGILTTVLWGTFMICASLRLFKKIPWLSYVQRGLLVGVALSAAATFAIYTKQSDFGVVTSEEANVYSGQSTKSVLLFRLHEGTEFTIKSSEQDWLRLVLADGKTGWMHKKHAIH